MNLSTNKMSYKLVEMRKMITTRNVCFIRKKNRESNNI